MSKKVVTFGEIMLRLAPEGYYRFVQADTFGATMDLMQNSLQSFRNMKSDRQQ